MNEVVITLLCVSLFLPLLLRAAAPATGQVARRRIPEVLLPGNDSPHRLQQSIDIGHGQRIEQLQNPRNHTRCRDDSPRCTERLDNRRDVLLALM